MCNKAYSAALCVSDHVGGYCVNLRMIPIFLVNEVLRNVCLLNYIFKFYNILQILQQYVVSAVLKSFDY